MTPSRCCVYNHTPKHDGMAQWNFNEIQNILYGEYLMDQGGHPPDDVITNMACILAEIRIDDANAKHTGADNGLL